MKLLQDNKMPGWPLPLATLLFCVLAGYLQIQIMSVSSDADEALFTTSEPAPQLETVASREASGSGLVGVKARLTGIRDALLGEIDERRLYSDPDELKVRRLVIDELNDRLRRWQQYQDDIAAKRQLPPPTSQSRAEIRVNRLQGYRLQQTDTDDATRESVIDTLVRHDMVRRELSSQPESTQVTAKLKSDEEVIRELLTDDQFESYQASEQQFIESNRLINAMSQINRDAGQMTREAKNLLAKGVAAMRAAQISSSRIITDLREETDQRLLEIENLKNWFQSVASQSDSDGAWFYFERLRLNWEQAFAIRHLSNI